ncbi:methyl-accepting chemotaxis protein [Tepidimonas charontis]|uniref:Methyl-accepting chemotaxis protein III n=1 Tax=Tepidimonas charontis TaxID=2267262 RepID=A0A554X4L9_9BURK|nr:methyl-accepting chemotaxis protein [Tepidimonas charontis]TSE30784.1 Methyl-accepting chemotaxis protein III [Tepidimonas charontis]
MNALLNRLRLTQRVFAVIVGYLVVLALVVSAGLWGLYTAKTSLREVHAHRMAISEALTTLLRNYYDNRLHVLLAFQHAPDSPTRALHDHPTSMHLDVVKQQRESNNQALKTIESMLPQMDDEEQRLYQAVMDARKAWQAKRDQALEAVRAENFGAEVMQAFLVAGRTEGAAFEAAMQKLRDLQHRRADEEANAAERRYHFNLALVVAVLLLGALPMTVLMVATLRRMSTGFRIADETATAIAAGDLSRAIVPDGRDEIAHVLQQLEQARQGLRELIGNVVSAADSIASAASQVASGTLDLSQRTEQQASSLEQTASATEQLNSTVHQNAANAQQANDMAEKASAIAERGGDVVRQVVQTMNDINESSQRIANIIGVIDGIAFQTNILALNAAVEAARAGEAGRGFAVVASEVRNLASRSAEAAREIKALISDSVTKVGTGKDQVDAAGATMAEIVHSIKRVTELMRQIATSSAEQADGLGQINQAVALMDGVTQQNAALVEEASAAAAALREQAQQLTQQVGRFRLR